MFKSALTSFFLALILMAAAVFVYYRSSVTLSVRPESGDFFPKETIHMQVTLRNSGLAGRYFFIDVKSDLASFAPRALFLARGSAYTASYKVAVPTASPQGVYPVEVAVRAVSRLPFGNKSKPETLARKNIMVTVKEPPAPKVPEKPVRIVVKPKPPEPATGSIKFTVFPEELSYGATNTITLSAGNTSDRTVGFIVIFNVTGSSGQTKAYTNELILSSATSQELPFELVFDLGEPDGQYFATAELRESGTNRLIYSDSVIMKLLDRPPKAEIRDFLSSPVEKNRYEAVAKITDDTGVNSAMLNYSDLARGYTTSYRMNMIFGDTRDGLWSCSFKPYKKSKEFNFYVEAMDVRNNVSRSEERANASFAGIIK